MNNEEKYEYCDFMKHKWEDIPEKEKKANPNDLKCSECGMEVQKNFFANPDTLLLDTDFEQGATEI